MSAPAAIAAGTPESAPYIAALCPALAARTISQVPRAVLVRERIFRPLFWNQARNAVTYSVVTILAAIVGAGAWSIVIGQLVASVTSLVALMTFARYSPRLNFDTTVIPRLRTKAHVAFFFTLSTYVARNADYWFVGHAAGPAVLGVYYVAYVLPNLIRMRLTSSLGEVVLPTFVRLRNQPAELRARYLQTLGTLALVGLPTLCGLGLLAHQLIEVFFGQRWEPATVPMVILSAAAALEFVNQASVQVFWALDAMRAIRWMQSVRIGSYLALLCAVPFGDSPLLIAAIANLIAVSLWVVVSHIALRNVVGLALRDSCHACLAPLLATAGMALIVLALRISAAGALTALPLLVACVVCGLVTYIVCVWLLRRQCQESLTLVGQVVSPILPRRLRAHLPARKQWFRATTEEDS
jgi:PST family polysaccharide transporter